MKNRLKENERIDDLEYEGLKIIQNEKEFCFGVDSVLLSDFAKDIRNNSTVVDMGTGTGIISILLSKKTNASKIIAVEIQEQMCDMARRSVDLNGLEEKIEVINEDIKDLEKVIGFETVDAIVTNPPYKKIGSGIKNEKESKSISRHEILCNIEDIIRVSSRLLKDNGSIYIVHRPERLVDVICALKKYRLEPKKLRMVEPKKSKAPNIFLIKATKNAGEFLKVEKSLVVYEENGEYTDEILEIYNKK